jgi:HSP20 family protein
MSISRFFPEFRQLQKELFDDPFLGHFLKGFGPRMDVVEMNDQYVLRADVPGYKKDQIDIDIRGSNICIKGTMDGEVERKDERIVSQERIQASFSRCLSLPFQADPSKVKASLEHGVLEISVPKNEVQGNKVAIQ